MGAIVLVVDDEVSLADVIRLLIEDLGHRVLTASDGAEALELSRNLHPDLVISDIMMPRLHGDELCRRLKTEPATADIKIVLMSAAFTLRAERAGADAFLIKPFDLGEVEELIRKLVAA